MLPDVKETYRDVIPIVANMRALKRLSGGKGFDMFIPDFWCGVVATILVEIACVVAGVIILSAKGGQQK